MTRIRPGVFGLRGLHEPSAQAATVPETSGGDVHEVDRDEANLRVRVPFFPIYSELRHLLRIWPGPPRRRVTGLQATFKELRGTPQKAVDRTNPSIWILERLEGDDRDLARLSGQGREAP